MNRERAFINQVTARLDEIIEPLLTRDASGGFKEEFGYPRRSSPWPGSFSGLAEWMIAYEMPPDHTSTGQVLFSHCFCSVPPLYPNRGFYVNLRFVGDNLEGALFEMKRVLEHVKKRGN